MAELYPHQIQAVEEMHNGCILCGGVGTGKSRTALYYYITKVCDGSCRVNGKGRWRAMRSPRPLYVITTAKKRDDGDWIKECLHFNIFKDKVVIDSWNNIKKYRKIYGAFFIFDEDRVTGNGAWVKSFLEITKKNKWVILSATPGDKWVDYIPVFVANGFYTSASDFKRKHVLYDPYITQYPRIRGYYNEKDLYKHRSEILVPMSVVRNTVRHVEYKLVDYDKSLYRMIWKNRWNPYTDGPIDEVGELLYTIRRSVNSDQSRFLTVLGICQKQCKTIIFYNFDFELELLKALCDYGFTVAEWNGKRHEQIPDCDKWVYLVQYNAGSEGWNCTTTDTIIFYSLNYSYRMMVQASGRIDRMNTSFIDLYYYYIVSSSPIDRAIKRALVEKRDFNERAFVKH